MTMYSRFIFGLLSTGLVLAMPAPTQAQLKGTNPDNFRYISQPLALRTGVTAAGLGLIGLELWWFLISQAKAQQEESHQEESIEKVGILPLEVNPISGSISVKSNPNKEDNTLDKYSQKVAVGVSTFCGAMRMTNGVFTVEDKTQPRFSAAC